MFNIKSLQGTPAFMEAFTETVYCALYNSQHPKKDVFKAPIFYHSKELLQSVIDIKFLAHGVEPTAIIKVTRFK